jgi:hypothetical protein
MATITVKLNDKTQAALVWAINIFEMSREGGIDDDLDMQYHEALKALTPLYGELAHEAAANA